MGTKMLALVSAAVGASLLATLAQVPPAAGAAPGTKPAVQSTRSVSGYDAAPKRSSGPAKETPPGVVAPVWPAAGKAVVALPTAGSRPETRAEGVAAGKRTRAGSLPVWVAATGGASPGAVQVQMFDRAATARAGVTGLLVRLSRADDEGSSAPVSLSVDYSGFATAVGGDWSSRLRLVRLPACAATTPEAARCQTQQPVRGRNDVRHKTVTATAEAGSGEMYAVTAAASGGAGSYEATPLGPSSTWQVSAQTGDFSWSYPLRVPPAVNGPAPELTIGYSSGSVDGRTASTNNQPSWLGEGHSLETGYVERKYVSCSDDKAGGNNATSTGDMCWKSDNATLVLGGRSGELVKAADGSWRLENDDGSKIERVTGAANGARGGEYWRLTTTDGTRYYFGINKRYGTDTASTNSVFTVPVFGNQPGEPCYQTSYAASYCTQAWRWAVERRLCGGPVRQHDDVLVCEGVQLLRAEQQQRGLLLHPWWLSDPDRVRRACRLRAHHERAGEGGVHGRGAVYPVKFHDLW